MLCREHGVSAASVKAVLSGTQPTLLQLHQCNLLLHHLLACLALLAQAGMPDPLPEVTNAILV